MAATRARPVMVVPVGMAMRTVRRAPPAATAAMRVQPVPVESAGSPERGVQSATTVPVAFRARRWDPQATAAMVVREQAQPVRGLPVRRAVGVAMAGRLAPAAMVAPAVREVHRAGTAALAA